MSEKHTKAPNHIDKVLGTEIWAALIEGRRHGLNLLVAIGVPRRGMCKAKRSARF